MKRGRLLRVALVLGMAAGWLYWRALLAMDTPDAPPLWACVVLGGLFGAYARWCHRIVTQ